MEFLTMDIDGQTYAQPVPGFAGMVTITPQRRGALEDAAHEERTRAAAADLAAGQARAAHATAAADALWGQVWAAVPADTRAAWAALHAQIADGTQRLEAARQAAEAHRAHPPTTLAAVEGYALRQAQLDTEIAGYSRLLDGLQAERDTLRAHLDPLIRQAALALLQQAQGVYDATLAAIAAAAAAAEAQRRADWAALERADRVWQAVQYAGVAGVPPATQEGTP